MDPEKKPSKPDEKSSDDRQEFHPDTPISPRNHTQETTTETPKTDEPKTAEQAPAPEESDSFFHGEGEGAENAPAPSAAAEPAMVAHDTGKEVAWTASEFIYHEKSPLWYAVLIGGGLVLSGGAWLASEDWVATFVVIAVVVLFGVGGYRKPRQMQYSVDDHGVVIGQRHFNYDLFRSFTIDVEDHFHSINLMPLKRFMPIISIYYDLDDEERITEVLSAHLPLDTHKPDLVEKLMRRIRF